MKHVRLGNTGLKVSQLCLGTMTFGQQCDEETSFALLDAALEAGIDFFDLADVYPIPLDLGTVGKTEEIFGRWLAARGGRERLVVASKCHGPMGRGPNDAGLSRKHVIAAAEASLRRLGVDYLDLYQVHFPDADTPIEETLEALSDLRRQGKVRYLGCSNFEAWRVAGALIASARRGLARFDCVQPRYNLLIRSPERDLLPLCRAEGLGVIPYNAQAGGFLTGKYTRSVAPPSGSRFSDALGSSARTYRDRYWKDEHFAVAEELMEIARDLGATGGQLAIAWLIHRPEITAPIVGATSLAQLRESTQAVELTLPPEIMTRLDALTARFV